MCITLCTSSPVEVSETTHVCKVKCIYVCRIGPDNALFNLNLQTERKLKMTDLEEKLVFEGKKGTSTKPKRNVLRNVKSPMEKG